MITGIRTVTAIMALTALGACAEMGIQPMTMTAPQMTAEEVAVEVQRAFDSPYAEIPFSNGAISVVATERGKISTFLLVPCQSGNGICTASPIGRAGSLTVSPDFYIVQGTYRNRTFFLRPGGGGWLRTGNVDVPLAWNSTINGIARTYDPEELGD
ncbi:MAG: hypothetical protein NTX73_20195 [Rhodobacterales bacterium]|nr:hypothetical protein [Rhodobacterales bacterium]